MAEIEPACLSEDLAISVEQQKHGQHRRRDGELERDRMRGIEVERPPGKADALAENIDRAQPSWVVLTNAIAEIAEAIFPGDRLGPAALGIGTGGPVPHTRLKLAPPPLERGPGKRIVLV